MIFQALEANNAPINIERLWLLGKFVHGLLELVSAVKRMECKVHGMLRLFTFPHMLYLKCYNSICHCAQSLCSCTAEQLTFFKLILFFWFQVKTRLASDSGMSFTEFAYQLLQGYDFHHLFREEGVRVQIGGSDQWGNITAGTDLIRKLWNNEEELPLDAYGLTFPLLVGRSICGIISYIG